MLINVQGENMNSKPEQSGLNTAESGAIHSQNDAEAHLKERKTEQQKFKRAQNVKHVSLANALFAMLPRRGRGLPHMKPRHSKGVLESAIEEAADQQDVLINEEVTQESAPEILEAVNQEPEAATELEAEAEIKVDEVEAEPKAEEPTPEFETAELEEVTKEVQEQEQELEPVQLQQPEAAPELEPETDIKVEDEQADAPTLETVKLEEVTEEVQEPEAAPELEAETDIKVEAEQADEPTPEAVELEEVSEEVPEQPQEQEPQGIDINNIENDNDSESKATDMKDTDVAETANATEDGGEFSLTYDVTSKRRYVDLTSQKTEFERVLEELAKIGHDILSWEVEKFTSKFATKKYQGSGSEEEATAQKYEAFLGGFITNAAQELYDRGYRETAFRYLEQTKNVLEARQKLESEVESIKTRVEESEDLVDVSDILGLFGDGD